MARVVRRPLVRVLAGLAVLLLALALDAVVAQPEAEPLISDDEFIRLRAAPVADPPTGARLFVGNCATCHGSGKVGRGEAEPYARLILTGIRRGDDGSNVVMPGFAAALSDEEIATLVSFLVERVGGTVGTMTPGQVAALRGMLGLQPAP